MNYESHKTIVSEAVPGVSFTLRRMSFERRLELTRRLKEVLQRIEFLDSGNDPRETIEAALLTTEVDRVYLLWGLSAVTGLEIDWSAATPETLFAAGPEELSREIVSAIKAECGLSEAERKN